ncbi:hypothetical protein HELRODRAFT_189442 [Helobdella robusta]|uniref:UNC93-like protein MFSD11 n=1 Tax=Helobdella robusta TaxID=6412 RepID=T1FR23_HELRO|nr:hypothetical protein HELRODRAFT_189442 [Helobdella robusta]ESN94579.1 hypothetical protein HELRODRAFT_189442 [Helobdella robusta]
MPIDEVEGDVVHNNNTVQETEADRQSVGSSDSEASLGVQLSSRWKFYNVILMGITFMFLFTAFNTCSMIQTLVLEGANIETNNTSGNGYTSLALLYGAFAASNWVAPSFVAVFNSKWSMIIGSSLYCVFIGFFLRPNQISLYITSVLIGFGAAILWTAQGKFLISNSTLDTMTRNTGIFWVLFQSSLIWGNIFVIFKFTGLTSIDGPTRTVVFAGLTSAACLVQSVKLLFNKEMLLLSVIFFYTGLSTSFWSSVFITSVGHMSYFEDDAKQLSGLCGLTAGFGEMCGGLLFGIFSKSLRINASNRGFVMFVGYVLQMVALFAAFLTLAPESPIMETDNLAYFTPK